MARQLGPLFVTGTVYDITFYKMFEIYYARMKSSLSRKKVLTSPRFARTRMHANQLAEASQIASQLYKSVPKEAKNMKFFRSIVGKAKILLASGEERETVLKILSNLLFTQAKPSTLKQAKKSKANERIYVNKKGRLVWKELNSPNPYLNIEKGTGERKSISNLGFYDVDINFILISEIITS